jgi:phage internal scaffolding protein
MKKNEVRKDIYFRTPFDPSEDDGLECTDKSLTQQQFKEESDINNILKKFENTGQLPEMIKAQPQYGDFSTVPDYQEAMHTISKAVEQFEALSSKIRDRFQNNPENFLAFATDPTNVDEMVSMGLAEAKKILTPEEIPVAAKTTEKKPPAKPEI